MRFLPTLQLCFAAFLAGSAVLRAEIPVFRDGRVMLPVVVSAQATVDEHAAAQELSRALGLMSGLEWPVRVGDLGTAGLHVGRHSGAWNAGAPPLAVDWVAPKPGEVGPDAFRIRTHGGSVLIDGATGPATRFAVAWFLEKQAGVRWYAPGRLGEVIPLRAEFSVPLLDVTLQPAYLSREMHGAGLGAGSEWGWRNGLKERFEYSHALDRVFPAESQASHPDWLPVVRGERQQPVPGEEKQWQPNFARPTLAVQAAEAAGAAFAREPERRSFSLGINDTLRYDQGEDTQARVLPLRYFRGRPDYSALVFSFMNRAAEQLAARRTDRYLGCLAYLWCEAPPPFAVHPQVLPYLTADRTQYYDSAFRAEDHALLSRWSNSGVRTFGLWEYAYGDGYLVPRVPIKALASALREGWRQGARGYVVEMNPHPGFDAFKAWALAKLLWEPERDVEEFAGDFFAGYYGSAARPMRRFFDRCEELWMQQEGPAHWLKYHQQEDQARLFPEEACRELRGLLDESLRLADDPVVVERVDLASRAFAVTEAFVRFDELRRRVSELNGAELSSGPVSGLVAAVSEMAAAEQELRSRMRMASAGETPAMAPTDLEPFLINDPVPGLLWRAGRGGVDVPQRLTAFAGAEVRWRRLAEAIASGRLDEAPSLLRNGGFRSVAETGPQPAFLYPHSGDLPADWQWRAVPAERGLMGLQEGAGDAADRVLRIEGAWDSQVYQWVPAAPGTFCVARVQLRGCSSPGGEASLYLTFLTEQGEVSGPRLMQSLPKGLQADWQEMVLADEVPPTAAWVGMGFGASRQTEADWLEIRSPSLQGISVGEGQP